jgi:hypothetical protein
VWVVYGLVGGVAARSGRRGREFNSPPPDTTERAWSQALSVDSRQTEGVVDVRCVVQQIADEVAANLVAHLRGSGWAPNWGC